MNDQQLEFDYNVNTGASRLGAVTTSTSISGVGTGISGATLVNGPTTTYWSTSPYNGLNPLNGLPSTSINTDFIIQGKIKAKDVDVDGMSLKDALNMINERLAILTPNEALEGRWEELKELGDKYRQLEKELLDKEYVWNKIKD